MRASEKDESTCSEKGLTEVMNECSSSVLQLLSSYGEIYLKRPQLV